MVVENDFVPFATGGGANVLSQSAYLANSATTAGQQPGIASSALNNKALRQACFIASCLAQYLANTTGEDILDNGVQADLIATLGVAFNNPPTTTLIRATGAGTYTIPVGTTYLEIEGIGAGAGGDGSSTQGANNGGAGSGGGNTTFGPITAVGGTAGIGGRNQAPAGGTVSLGVGPIDLGSFQGAAGGPGTSDTIATTAQAGGMGGVSPYGGAGAGGYGNGVSPGQDAIDNTGSGGGGAGDGTSASAEQSGNGGAVGGFIKARIQGSALTALGATVAYSVGVGGSGGTAGTAGLAGGAGGSGFLKITAY